MSEESHKFADEEATVEGALSPEALSLESLYPPSLMAEEKDNLLLEAIDNGDIEEVRKLFPPSDPDLLNGIASDAAQEGETELLGLCLSHGFFLHTTSSLNDPFYLAAMDGGDPEVFRMLVGHGVDLNAHVYNKDATEFDGSGTALSAAVERGNTSLVAFLLSSRQNPNSILDRGAIVSAVRGRAPSTEIVELLLKHGLILDHDVALLAGAAEKGNMEMIQLLLDSGADLEATNMPWLENQHNYDLEGTALYRACRAGKLRAVEYLLERGAKRDFTDSMGRSCLAIAKLGRFGEICKLLGDNSVQERLALVEETNWVGVAEVPSVFKVD